MFDNEAGVVQSAREIFRLESIPDPCIHIGIVLKLSEKGMLFSAAEYIDPCHSAPPVIEPVRYIRAGIQVLIRRRIIGEERESQVIFQQHPGQAHGQNMLILRHVVRVL